MNKYKDIRIKIPYSMVKYLNVEKKKLNKEYEGVFFFDTQSIIRRIIYEYIRGKKNEILQGQNECSKICCNTTKGNTGKK